MKRILTTILALTLTAAPLLGQWGMGPGPGMPASSGGSTVTHYQSCGNQGSSTPSSVSCTFGSAIRAGDFLWMCVANAVTTALGAVAWSGDSGTFTVEFPFTPNTPGSGLSGCYYIPSAGGGGSTITLTATNLSYPGLTIDEFSPVGAKDSSDYPSPGVNNNTSGSTTSVTSNTIAVSVGDLILGFSSISPGGGPTYTVGSGFTAGAGSTYTSQNEYILSSPSTSANATFTLSATYGRGWMSHVVAFKP